MEISREKYNVVESTLQAVGYFMSKRLALWKMNAFSCFVLSFLQVRNIYASETHHFHEYFAKNEIGWKTWIVIFVFYPILFFIAFFKLKLLHFLNNKECKNNERI